MLHGPETDQVDKSARRPGVGSARDRVIADSTNWSRKAVGGVIDIELITSS
jgi:hypothetical protein